MKDRYSAEAIVKPWVTEKSMLLVEKFGQYIFEISGKATKLEVRRAVEEMFGVETENVNILKKRGKTRSLKYWQRGKTPDKKLAIVKLKKGQKIDIFG